jgi:hypothetical protein
VFQQKRKEFNSAKQRLIEEEQLKKTQTARGGKARPTTATTRQAPAAQKPAPKKVDWRAQSEAFRAVVKSAKGGTMTKEVPNIAKALAIANGFVGNELEFGAMQVLRAHFQRGGCIETHTCL